MNLFLKNCHESTLHIFKHYYCLLFLAFKVNKIKELRDRDYIKSTII